MQQPVSYKPKDFHSITPYLLVNGADKFIEFTKAAFDAEEIDRFMRPGTNVIMHAVIKIGDAFIEISDGSAEYPPMQTALHFYVPDVDAVFKKAIQAGGISKMEPREQFYGDRESFVLDPFGNHWYISTHVKDVSEQEINQHSVSQN